MRMLGLFMVMPVIAIAAVSYPDYSPLLVGLAIGGYGLSQALLQIPMGMLSDKWGRKPIIFTGLVLFASGSALAAYADSLWLVAVGRVLQGSGAVAGAIMALAGDISRENQRSKVMAIIGIAIGFSFYLALLLGPFIASGFGLKGIFAVTAILALLCVPVLLFLVPTTLNHAPRGDTLPNVHDLRTLVQNPSLWRLNLSVLVLHMLITLMFVQLPLRFEALGWGINQHWQLYLPILLLSILGMGFLMMFARRSSVKKILLLSVVLLMLVLLLLGQDWQSMTPIFVLMCGFFVAFNYLEANFPALVSSIAPAGQKGSAMGIYASFQFFGAFLGGVLSGTLQQYAEPQMIYWLAALLCLLWFGVLLGFPQADKLMRYALPLNLDKQSPEMLRERLSDMPGVQDFAIVVEDAVVYLKVDAKDFDLPLARQLASGK